MQNSLTQFHQCAKQLCFCPSISYLHKVFVFQRLTFFTTTFFTIMRIKNLHNYKSFNPGNYPTCSYRNSFCILKSSKLILFVSLPDTTNILFSFCSYLLIRLSSAGVGYKQAFKNISKSLVVSHFLGCQKTFVFNDFTMVFLSVSIVIYL